MCLQIASDPARNRDRGVVSCVAAGAGVLRLARGATRELVAMPRASGTFEVQLVPQPADDHGGGAALARMSIDKRFAGDLEGRSRGQMLSAMTMVKGSAGYVALEVVTGALGGRAGTFVLQHSGTMHRGAASLALGVVPDSGTGALAGLAGSMAIDVADGRHSYRFDYTLAEPD